MVLEEITPPQKVERQHQGHGQRVLESGSIHQSGDKPRKQGKSNICINPCSEDASPRRCGNKSNDRIVPTGANNAKPRVCRKSGSTAQGISGGEEVIVSQFMVAPAAINRTPVRAVR